MSLFNTLIPSLSRTPASHSSANNLDGAVKPVFNITETDEAYSVTVFLPGVAKDGIELTSEDGQFRVVGRRAWKQPEGWTALYSESANAPFELVLTHDNAIDAEKVVAELNDGVLRLSLPKHEAVKPRKIAVN